MLVVKSLVWAAMLVVLVERLEATVSRCDQRESTEPYCRKFGYCFEVGAVLTNQGCDKFCKCERAGWMCEKYPRKRDEMWDQCFNCERGEAHDYCYPFVFPGTLSECLRTAKDPDTILTERDVTSFMLNSRDHKKLTDICIEPSLLEKIKNLSEDPASAIDTAQKALRKAKKADEMAATEDGVQQRDTALTDDGGYYDDLPSAAVDAPPPPPLPVEDAKDRWEEVQDIDNSLGESDEDAEERKKKDNPYALERCPINSAEISHMTCRKYDYCMKLGTILTTEDCERQCVCQVNKKGSKAGWKCANYRSNTIAHNICLACRNQEASCANHKFVRGMLQCIKPSSPAYGYQVIERHLLSYQEKIVRYADKC